MVASHRPSRPEPIVVKCGRSRSSLRQQKTSCVVCGADLRGDHVLGDCVCDSHPCDGYNPHHDPRLDERILVLLWRARGAPVNLYRALGCDSLKENYNAIHASVTRLNASGMVRVVGVGAAGRKLVAIRSRRSATVKA
jgi:hypothetical protein